MPMEPSAARSKSSGTSSPRPVKCSATRPEATDSQALFPLWEQLHNLVPAVPSGACVPAHWSYSKLRPSLMEAG